MVLFAGVPERGPKFFFHADADTGVFHGARVAHGYTFVHPWKIVISLLPRKVSRPHRGGDKVKKAAQVPSLRCCCK
jgi:hypothetical protein